MSELHTKEWVRIKDSVGAGVLQAEEVTPVKKMTWQECSQLMANVLRTVGNRLVHEVEQVCQGPSYEGPLILKSLGFCHVI